MLSNAIEVLEAWGFTYKTCAVWSKDRIRTGYWFRNKHEILLVGTRGHVPGPAMGTQWPSLVEASVGGHSEKPSVFCEMIEIYFPTLPKIELHACGIARRAGWDVWGLEAPACAEIRHAESAADDRDEAAIDHAASEAIRRTSDEQSGISDRATGSI
jgi:N6-adenosine-specific RNA methylase IME4